MTSKAVERQIPWGRVTAAALLLPCLTAGTLYAKMLPDNVLIASGCVLTAMGGLLTLMAHGIVWGEAEQKRLKRDREVMQMCHGMALAGGVLAAAGVFLVNWSTLFKESAVDALAVALLAGTFAWASGSLATMFAEKTAMKNQSDQKTLRACRLTILAASPLATAGVLILCRGQLG